MMAKKGYEPTGIFGGEHDDEGLSVEGVCPTGLTAIIVGVVFNYRHCLLPGEERYFITTSYYFILRVWGSSLSDRCAVVYVLSWWGFIFKTFSYSGSGPSALSHSQLFTALLEHFQKNSSFIFHLRNWISPVPPHGHQGADHLILNKWIN